MLRPQRSPVAGSAEAGDVVPKGLPSRPGTTTGVLSGSNASPGPTSACAQPDGW